MGLVGATILTIGRYSHSNMKEKADAVARLPLPGAEVGDNSFAAMSRHDLEAAAAAMVVMLRTLTTPAAGPVLDTPGDTPALETAGDGGRLTGTNDGRPAGGRRRRKA